MAGRQVAGEIGGGDSVRRGGDWLARRQNRERTAAAIGPHSDLQPACRPRTERGRPEIQHGGKQAVSDAGRRVRNGSAHGAPAGKGVVEREAQIESAIGGAAVVREPALVGKGGALSVGWLFLVDS